MGKGCKDKARLITKDYAEPSSNKGIGGREQQQQNRPPPPPGHRELPPGIPECDVVLKGSKRFWYLEPALFIFGVAGFIFSAVMLLRSYLLE